MGPRRRRDEIGRLLRARIEDPVDDPTFTRELAARAKAGDPAPRRRSRAAIIAVAVVAPALVLGSLGVAYGTGLVRAPWRQHDVPARVPGTPVPTHSSSPSERPTRSASTNPSQSPSPSIGGDDLSSSPSSTPSGGAPSATPTSPSSATASPTATTSPRPTKTPDSPKPTKAPKPTKPAKPLKTPRAGSDAERVGALASTPARWDPR